MVHGLIHLDCTSYQSKKDRLVIGTPDEDRPLFVLMEYLSCAVVSMAIFIIAKTVTTSHPLRLTYCQRPREVKA